MRQTNPSGWKTVRTIAMSRAFSLLGDELAIFALTLRIKHNGGGPLAIAAIMAAGQLPLIVLSPWAGTVADRIPVRRLAPIVTGFQAIFATLLVFNSPLFVSVALIFLIGVGQAIAGPAWSATLPEIVGKEALPRAMSMAQTFYAMAGIAGPAVAGLMVAKLGYVTPMLADAATFALISFVPYFLTLPFHARDRQPREKGDVWVGLQVVRKEPLIRALTILGFSLNVTVGMYSVGELFFILNNLHASTFVYGLIGSTFAAGALTAGFVNQRRTVSKERLPANIISGAVMAGLGIFLTGCVWQWAFLFPIAALTGIGVSTLNAYFFALMLQRAPEKSRGRVSSAVQGVTSAGQIASFAIGGAVVSVIDPRIAILLSGMACLVTTGALARTVLGASKGNPIIDLGSVFPITDFPEAELE